MRTSHTLRLAAVSVVFAFALIACVTTSDVSAAPAGSSALIVTAATPSSDNGIISTSCTATRPGSYVEVKCQLQRQSTKSGNWKSLGTKENSAAVTARVGIDRRCVVDTNYRTLAWGRILVMGAWWGWVPKVSGSYNSGACN
jgi:hypothetical protein